MFLPGVTDNTLGDQHDSVVFDLDVMADGQNVLVPDQRAAAVSDGPHFTVRALHFDRDVADEPERDDRSCR